MKNKNTPAWVSALAALIVTVMAVWSFASSPAEDQLDDHEQRLRKLEYLTAEQLSSIDQRLKTLSREVTRLRDNPDRAPR